MQLSRRSRSCKCDTENLCASVEVLPNVDSTFLHAPEIENLCRTSHIGMFYGRGADDPSDFRARGIVRDDDKRVHMDSESSCSDGLGP